MTTAGPTARAARAAAAPTKKTTTRKRTPAKATPPAVSAMLDLDTLQREGGALEPFTFLHQGQVYLLRDPLELDWQQTAQALGNPAMYLHLMLPEEQREEFYAHPMAVWKLRALVDRYQEYYSMPSAGESVALPS
jgi:hypothetical protein